MSEPSSCSVNGLRELMRERAEQLGGQSRLAGKLGVSPSFISDILNGSREPSDRIARQFGYMKTSLFIRMRK